MIGAVMLLLLAQGDDPETERRSFQVAEGYEVNLFASEKEGIVKPLQIRWDPQGRMWVTCAPSYPQLRPGEKADDKVVVLEDSDHDGRADKSSVFVSGLSMPMGLELGRGGIYVTSGADLLHVENRDGQAGRPRTVLRGFFSGDSHQNINSFVWGPSGELMFCQGLHIFSHVETPWGLERLEKAGVWRLWDRRLRLDPFLGDDMGPQNPYGVVFDDWAQPIMVSGNGQGIYYLLPLQIRTRHFQPVQQIWDRTNKLAGADILGSRHLPDDVQGRMVCGGFLNNAVYWFKLSDDGSGFRAKDAPPLIVSKHSSFRAVDVRAGPDGAIYVADWYNPIIGHYQASFRHPDRDKAHGRIWRITAKGRPLVKQPDLHTLPTADLLEQLRSPERWTRTQSRRLLGDKDPKEVLPAVSTWVGALDAKDPLHDRLLIDALGIFMEHETANVALLQRLHRSKDFRTRAYGTRAIGHWHDRLENATELLASQAADEHPRVRLEAVVAASYVPKANAIEAAAVATDYPMDRFIQHAFTQTVHALKPHWKPVFDEGKLECDGRISRLQAVIRADGSKDVLAQLVALLRSEKIPQEARGSALVLLAGVGGPDDLAMALRESPSPAVLEALISSHRLRKAIPSGDLASALRRVLEDPATQSRGWTLAGLWKLEAFRGEMEAAARISPAAMEGLADLGGEASIRVLKGLAEAGRAEAAIALTRLQLPAAAQAAAGLFAQGDPSAVVEAFLARQGGSEALAQALTGAKISPDTAKLSLRAMSSAGRADEPLKTVFSKAAGISSAAIEYSAEFVKALGSEAMTEGDAARGEKVYRGTVTNCFSCHAIGGAGGKVGPDVSAVGTALPMDLLIESVLWPNRQVKEGFTSSAVITRSDQIYQGFRVTEDKQLLVLRDPAREDLIRIPVADIRARKEIGSVMPEGLTNGLTRAELRDLIRFLAELGKPGPYRVAERPVVRRWRVVARDAPEVAKFSTVAGELPVEDISAGTTLRFEVEVVRPGQFLVQLNSPKGLDLTRDVIVRDLDRGRHFISLTVLDPSLRAGLGLRIQVDPAPGTSGELRLLQ